MLPVYDRAPGSAAVSRWYSPDGSWEWRPCTMLRAEPDGSSFLIRWVHSSAIKEVSRFNMLMPGEDEASLDALIAAAQRHQVGRG